MNGPPALDRTLAGVLLGTAVGDALGLPMEGLSAARRRRLFPGPIRHRFIGRFGMMSDDTEHTFFVAQALLQHPQDASDFQRALGWKLRWWLLALPAGVGFATLRAILKLWLGVPPDRSGIFSAGNGPAMRSAVIGVFFAHDPARRESFVCASSRLTHRDPRAKVAALAVAEVGAWMSQRHNDLESLLERLASLDQAPEWAGLIGHLRASLAEKLEITAFAQKIGSARGVSGYAYQSVPVALYAALRCCDDFSAAVGGAIACGGDTDTVAAITGALLGARVGEQGIPESWLAGLVEWPRSIGLLRRVAERLALQKASAAPLGPVCYPWPAILLRNLIFLAIVLVHGFRRLLPPY